MSVSEGAPWLELRAVSRRFQDGVRGSVEAVRGLSLTVPRGEVVLLSGPSGAGKSTVVALASAILLPTSGEVLFEGGAFSRLREAFRARLRRARLGVVLQQLALVPGMSALENALLASVPDGSLTRASIARAEAVFERLGVGALSRARVSTLSGGERQRVALSRALVHSPDVLLWDEPTAHLDATHSATVLALLREHAERGGGALVATHDPRVLEAGLPGRAVALVDGALRG